MAKRRRRKAVTRKGTRRARTTRAARPNALGGAVQSLRVVHQELLARRAELDDQIRALEDALSTVSGTSLPRRVGRPPGTGRIARLGIRGPRGARAGSLKEFITKVLRGGGTMAVKDITAGVLKAGYKSRNKTLAKSVGAALTDMPSVKKVGRGRFRLG